MKEEKLPIKEIYEQMHATAEAAGLQILSDDWCCKLLAWLYAYGGANEAVIFNYKLNTDILTAQKRLNIDGGEIPNPELLPLLQSYLKEVNPLNLFQHSKNMSQKLPETLDEARQLLEKITQNELDEYKKFDPKGNFRMAWSSPFRLVVYRNNKPLFCSDVSEEKGH